MPLEWRQVDFDSGEVGQDARTTKNDDGRVFPMTVELRAVLKAQHVEHLRLKNTGQLEPWAFFRMVAEGRGGVCRGGLPRSHSARPPTDCSAKLRARGRAGTRRDAAHCHKTPSVFNRYNITSP